MCARVIVIEARAAIIRDLLCPEIQSALVWCGLIHQEIRIVLPDEESLIVDGIRRGGQTSGPEQAVSCPAGEVAQFTEACIAINEPDDPIGTGRYRPA